MIMEPLLHIYNLSFLSGAVPNKLKVAKVIPIYKKGDPTHPENYRPISLLNIFDKILEKLMYSRLYKHLATNNILYDYQFGFRKGHSTALAILEVVDNI
jgi:retron-type reverse transcriptase